MRSTPETTQERCQVVVRARAVQEGVSTQGSAGSKAPSVPKMGAEMAAQTHQQPQRERECHITMPHTQKHRRGVEKAKGGMEWKVTDTWVMR